MTSRTARLDWRVWAGVCVASLAAIPLLEPHYTAMQTAAGALDFREQTGSAPRAITAGLADVVFAISYGVLGVRGLRRFGRGYGPTLLATILLGAGAAADVVENLVLVANVARGDAVTNDAVGWMQIFGAVKLLIVPGFLLLAVLLLLAARRSLRDRRLSDASGEHE